MTQNSFEIEKIYIKQQNDLYKYKDQLFQLGIQYNTKSQVYSNPYEISDLAMNEVKWLCDKNSYTYEIKVEQYSDYDKKVKNLYKMITIDNSNFFIINRRNDKKVFIISIYQSFEKDIVNIVDCQNGKYFKLEQKVPDTYNKILEIYNMLLSINSDDIDYFDLEDFILVLSILLEEYDKDSSLKGKLIKFKNVTINAIEKKSQNNFLCNCVRGFYPETDFFIKNKRIVSSQTKNYVTYEQEMKIWKYLFAQDNRKYIGIRKEPTLFDLFINKKIFATINDFETKVIIHEVKNDYGKLKVKIFDGNNHYWLRNSYRKDELIQMVKFAR